MCYLSSMAKKKSSMSIEFEGDPIKFRVLEEGKKPDAFVELSLDIVAACIMEAIERSLREKLDELSQEG